MNKFELLEPTLATIENVNLRSEMFGEDTVPAVDIKLSIQLRNDVLDLFDPALRPLLYCKSTRPRPKDEQAALPLEEPNDLPDLRFPHLDTLHWNDDIEDCILVIAYGINAKSALTLTGCKANHFRLDCLEGGTVNVCVRIQRSRIDERTVGKLSGLIRREMPVTLTRAPASQAPLTEDDDNVVPLNPTQIFVDQHGGGDRQGSNRRHKDDPALHHARLHTALRGYKEATSRGSDA